MIKKVLVVLFILCMFSPRIEAQEENHKMQWVIYCAVGPYGAARIQGFGGGEYDMTKYSYPMYIGYFYSEDSKTVKWHSEVDFAEAAMKYWAEPKADYPLVYSDGYGSTNPEIVKGSKKLAWSLDDSDFFYAAVNLLEWKIYITPIRYERNAQIDTKWKPIFPKQVQIVGTAEESRNEISQPVRVAKRKLLTKDYVPTNWDPNKNSKRE